MTTRRQDIAFQAERLVVEECSCLRCGGVLSPLRKALPTAHVRCRNCSNPARVVVWHDDIAGDLMPKSDIYPQLSPRSHRGGGAPVDRFVVLIGHREGERAVYPVPGFQPNGRKILVDAVRRSGRRAAVELHLVS